MKNSTWYIANHVHKLDTIIIIVVVVVIIIIIIIIDCFIILSPSHHHWYALSRALSFSSLLTFPGWRSSEAHV